jgi:hypothetical protein
MGITFAAGTIPPTYIYVGKNRIFQERLNFGLIAESEDQNDGGFFRQSNAQPRWADDVRHYGTNGYDKAGWPEASKTINCQRFRSVLFSGVPLLP